MERPHVRSTAEEIIREMGLLTPEIQQTILSFEDNENYETGVEFFAKEMNSVVEEDRWNAMGRMFYYCERFRDWGDDEGEGLTKHCTDKAIDEKLVPVLKELLTSFDNSLIEQAADTLDGIRTMKLENAVGEETLQAAIQRAQKQHRQIKAKYDQIQFKSNSNRGVLKVRMENTAEAIQEFENHLSAW